MVSDILGLAGSGAAGCAIGAFTAMMRARAENKRLELQLEIRRRANEAKQTLEYVDAVSNRPAHATTVFMLTAATCVCLVLCIDNPSRVLKTFNPDASPNRFSFLGFSYEWQRTQVYEITTGGVAYGLLHAVVLQIGVFITGSLGRR